MAQLIGELLVRAGALSAADLEEAVGWQVLYGGRLGTNLLELGVVDEHALAEALGTQLGCEFVSGELDVPASMVQMIPAVLARRHEIVPWRIEGRRLKVVTSNPLEAMPFLDELGFRVGRTIRPVVAPEYRVHQLLRRHFQSQRQMRALDFGQKVTRRDTSSQASPASATSKPLFDGGDELMDDEQFAKIYSHALQGRAGASPETTRGEPPPLTSPTPAPPTSPDVGQPASPWAIIPPSSTSRSPSRERSARGLDYLLPTSSAAVDPAHESDRNGETARNAEGAEEELLDEAFFEAIDDGEVVESSEGQLQSESSAVGDFESEQVNHGDPFDSEGPDFETERDATDFAEVGLDTARQWTAAFRELEKELASDLREPEEPAHDSSPLSFSEAVEAISHAEGREAVARAVLRYARSRAARAVLLNVQGNVALGWDAIGDDLSPESARRIAFSLTSPSAFRLVRESRSHYIGPLGREPGNVRFLKLAGKKWPSSAVLLPVLFRGRVVYVLYVDNGHRKHVDADVGELLILSQNITRSMEALVSRRQGSARR